MNTLKTISAMSLKIQTYTGTQQSGSFYIQSKGLNAGRPLRNPIRNCFVVYTDDELLFEKVYSLYVGKYFEYYLHGSVIPFICIDDVRCTIEDALTKNHYNEKELQAVRNVDEMLDNLNKKIQLYKSLQVALCRKINSESSKNGFQEEISTISTG